MPAKAAGELCPDTAGVDEELSLTRLSQGLKCPRYPTDEQSGYEIIMNKSRECTNGGRKMDSRYRDTH